MAMALVFACDIPVFDLSLLLVYTTYSPMTDQIKAELHACADNTHAKTMQRYFKTGVGEYGEGDRFIGVRVPLIRQIAKKYRHLPLREIPVLLCSPIHEERLLALILLTIVYPRSTPDVQEEIYRLYIDNMGYINNWDLVDVSAMHIIGAHLYTRSRAPLYELAIADNLWHRRIAIMSTFHFIRKTEYGDTLKIAELLLADTEDIIHKAVGWMLREIWKRDAHAVEPFLSRHNRCMPRTMLRYAIERMPQELRKSYLDGSIIP